jgi:hypothetical protein
MVRVAFSTSTTSPAVSRAVSFGQRGANKTSRRPTTSGTERFSVDIVHWVTGCEEGEYRKLPYSDVATYQARTKT